MDLTTSKWEDWWINFYSIPKTTSSLPLQKLFSRKHNRKIENAFRSNFKFHTKIQGDAILSNQLWAIIS